MLQLHNIGVQAGQQLLLDGIDLHVNEGEIHAVVGPNGAGKSTLLKVASGLCQPAVGTVDFDGAALGRRFARQRARQLAVLPQHSQLEFPFTVEEVVQLGRMPHESGWRTDRAIVAATLAALDITHLAQRRYPQLSGGEQQRTQLARVLAQVWRADDAAPLLLLLDEPTNALDLGHQQQLMALLAHIAAAGVAVVMVVHDVNLAAAHASHTLALRAGKMMAMGPTLDIFTAAMLSDLFAAPLHVVAHPLTGKPHVMS